MTTACKSETSNPHEIRSPVRVLLTYVREKTVDLNKVVATKLACRRCDILLDLLRSRRAGDHTGHLRTGEQPREDAVTPGLRLFASSKSGQPAHPLYQRADLLPVPFAAD